MMCMICARGVGCARDVCDVSGCRYARGVGVPGLMKF